MTVVSCNRDDLDVFNHEDSPKWRALWSMDMWCDTAAEEHTFQNADNSIIDSWPSGEEKCGYLTVDIYFHHFAT